MTEVPRAVLSEAFQKVIRGRRVKAAVFLTFKFDPGFFEEEVLPVFFDVPLSHSPTIRLLQLEDALRGSGAQISVYYDPRGLEAVERSAKLDIRRIPIRHRTGYFHPKNVLALVEDTEAAEVGTPPEALIVAATSANLTRAGWWENVEVCHIEEASAGEKCGFRDDLLRLMGRLRAEAPAGTDHEALEEIRRFVLKVDQYESRTGGGALHPRLYSGGQSVVDFLLEACGSRLASLNLEIISPYFDDSEDPKPLLDLVKEFEPRDVRVFLPRADDGSALCSEKLYRGLQKISNCSWGRLTSDLVRIGKGESVATRRVHAKVYRFFNARPRYEAFFVGSVNLTGTGHSRGGNFESGFLVETEPSQTPDWWLTVDRKEPGEFEPEAEDLGTEGGKGVALSVRYQWDTRQGWVLWDDSEMSPGLSVEAQGAVLFTLSPLQPREWVALAEDDAAALGRVLPSTAFLRVRVEGGEVATILVQEEGMSHRPSLLLTLSAAEILRSWALLTVEQRATFIEERASEIPEVARELGFEIFSQLPSQSESFFDRFAGIFHAFGCLKSSVLAAIEGGREREAVYRLFGQKYDSLPHLLDRIFESDAREDDVTRYVILLCARQLMELLERERPEFCHARRRDMEELEKRFRRIEEVRVRFTFATPEERARFFEWFERWFLTPAEVREPRE